MRREAAIASVLHATYVPRAAMALRGERGGILGTGDLGSAHLIFDQEEGHGVE
jgi:hypothetical protein